MKHEIQNEETDDTVGSETALRCRGIMPWKMSSSSRGQSVFFARGLK